MPDDICSKCNEQQWSVTDKHYLKQNGQCWSCDRALWENKELSTEEFERRERLANQAEEGGENDASHPAL